MKSSHSNLVTRSNLKRLLSAFVKRAGKTTLLTAALLGLVGRGYAQGISDAGSSAPTPGANDQYSLTSTANSGNYIDNQRPGQSFTVGANSLGYLLTDLYLQEASGTAGGGQPQATTYNIRVYSVSGTTATMLTQYVMTNTLTIVQGNWIRVSGLTNVLAANGVYGFSINRNGGGGWWTVRVDATQPYAGGTHGNFPAGNGTIATATSDMAFSASLTAIPDPYALATTITPANPVYVGQTATFSSARFFGASAFTFAWQSDGQSGGVTWTNFPGSTTNTYALDTTGMVPGTYQIRLVITDAAGSFTNAPATMVLNTPSVPGGTVAISPSATVAVGYDGVTFTPALSGNTPYGGYQWQKSDNATYTNNISGATNLTFTLNSVVVTNSGYYRLVATNTVGTGATAFAQLTVTNASSALVIDTGASNPATNATDIVQLSTTGNTQSPGGLNYYWQDNTPAPGQSFTTGANAAGYFLPAMYYKIQGAASGGTYTLRIYSLDSANSNNATLLSTYQTTYTGAATVSGDWMKWIGLTNVLAPNATYAYSVQGARMEIYNSSGNPYTGGRLALIALAGGASSVNYGTSSDFDGTFVLKLSSVSPVPAVAVDTTVSPASTVAGNVVTASATFTGLSPLSFQWQKSDLATYTNDVAGATNTSLTFYDVATTDAGYYRLVCTNSSGSATSSFAQLTVSPLTDVEILNVGGAPAASGLDISQLSTAGNIGNPSGLNYYDDNGTPPGQTFTTGSNPYGYTLNSLYIGMGSDGGHVSGVVYTLRLYSVFGGTATLVSTYVNNNTAPAIGGGSWTKWIGLTNILSPLTTYAYTISAGSTYLRVGNTTNNPYAGGQVCLIPAAGGTVNFGNASSYDGAFLAHLGSGPVVPDFGPTLTGNTTITPTGVFVGGTATMSAGFSGIPLPTYQWMFDNGGGGIPIASATNSTFILTNAQLANSGAYYLVASNNPNGSPSTLASSPVSLLVALPPQTNTTLVNIADGPAIGSTPTPGSNDVAQITGGLGYGWTAPSLVTNLNYYVNAAAPAGQTFTTGNTPPTGAGYPLTSISVVQELSSIGGGLSGTPESYTLNIYKMIGSNAVLLTSYQTVNTLTRTLNGPTDGYWLVFAGLTNMLSPSTTYAFSVKNNGAGYWKLGNDQDASMSSPDVYPDGQAAGLPASGIGAVSYSTDPNVDAAFVVGLTPLAAPTILVDTAITPAGALIQQAVSMSATFNGALPIYYQWQFNDGSGFVNIPGATNTTYSIASVNTTNAGQYQLFASNSVGTATSTAMTLTVLNPTTLVANFSYQIQYNGVGALPGGTGSYWNLMNTLGASTTSLADDGSTGVGITFNAQRIANFTGGATTIGLFQNYLLIQATTNLSFSFSNLPAGGYNVALYSANAAYHSSHTTFVIGNVTNTANATSDSAFILNNNYVVFTNILVTNGVLSGTYGRVTGEAALNGAQLQMAYSLENPAINILGQPADVSVPVGNPASVSVAAYAPGQVFYQWWINGGGPISGATNSSYSPNTSVVGTNSYYVVITNSTGLTPVTSAVGTVGVYLPDTMSWRGIDGTSPAAWDLSTLNWSNTVSQVDGVAYLTNDYALFDDTAASFVVSNATTLTPVKVTVNAANNYSFIGSGSLAGSMPLTKTGNGTLTISSVNTYTGGTTVNGGVLALAVGGGSGAIRGALNINPGATVNLTAWDALGYTVGACITPVNIYGGTLTNSGGNEGYSTVFNLRGGTMSSSLNGYNMYPPNGAAINSLATNIVSTISGNLILRGNGLTITTAAGTVPSGIDLNISGVIDNGGSGLTKNGNGTLSLSGLNGYNNDLTINAGTVRIDGAGLLAGGGNYSGVITNNGAFVYGSSAVQTLSGIISGTGTLTLNGNGTLRLNGVNTYTNQTTANAGTLAGTGTIAGKVTVNSGATLAPGSGGVGTLTVNGNLVLNGGSTNVFEVNGTTLAKDVIALGGNVTYGGVLQVVPSGTFSGGQNFTLFSGAGAASPSNFSSIVGSPGSGKAFTFTNGVLSVITTVNTNPTNITTVVNGGNLELSWPADHIGWRLQVQTNTVSVGLGTNWVDVAGATTVNSVTNTINPASGSVFYRMVYP